jgi:hypothetical protein
MNEKHSNLTSPRARVASGRARVDTAFRVLRVDVAKRFWSGLGLLGCSLLLLSPTFASAALTTNLVSYWKMDEASGNAADSVGSNTLTNTNSATFIAGKINNAASTTSGTAQYFTITDASQVGLDLSGDFTLAGWFWIADPTIDSALITKTSGGSQQSYYMYTNQRGKIFVDISSDGTQTASSYHRQATNSIVLQPAKTWIYVAATFTLSTNTTVIYINAAVASSTESYGTGITGGIFNSTSPFRVSGDGVDPGWKYNGHIDEVAVWSRALTSSEITSLYNGGAGCQYSFASCSGAVATPALNYYSIMWW